MEGSKYTYFLSDLHLGAPYIEGSREAERRVVKFLESIKSETEAIYLVGDILDYWYEYRYVVPRGFVRFFGKLAELVDSGIKVVWLIGNHDIWIFDYLPSELGVEVYDGFITEEIAGRQFFISHGDGLGRQPRSFRFIRSLFRNKMAQFFFSGIHPRWTVPFAYNWSSHSRKKGEQSEMPDEKLLYGLKSFSCNYHSAHPEVNYFVFGHVHVFVRERISENCEMIVLGEWIKKCSFARIKEGKDLEMHYWSGKKEE